MVDTGHNQLEQLRHGGQKAFKELFDQYYASLFYYASKFVDSTVARDIVQEAFIYIWQNHDHLIITTSINRYLFGVVRNMCLKHISKIQAKGRMLQNDELNLAVEELNHFSKEPEAINSLIEKEMDNKLDEALQQLPPRCLEIFLLSRKEGMKNREIASQLGISEKAVEKQITKALLHLRQELKDYLPLLLLLGRML